MWKKKCLEDVPHLVEFRLLVFTRMPVDSYRRWLGSALLCHCCTRLMWTEHYQLSGLLSHNCPVVCIAGLAHIYPSRMSSSYETTQSSLIMQRSTHVPFLWIFTTEFASRVRRRKRDWVPCWHGVIPTELGRGWSRDRLHSYSLWTVSFRLTEFGLGTIIFSSRKTREMCARRPFGCLQTRPTVQPRFQFSAPTVGYSLSK